MRLSTPRSWRMWLWCALTLLACLLPRELWAARPYGVVTVDLRPEIGEVPTHLCVVSQGQGPRTRQRLSELAQAQADEPGSLILDPALWGGAGERACEAGGRCLPRVELPVAQRGAQAGREPAEHLFVACTADSLVAEERARDPRVLVMMLEHLEGSPPLLESLKLAGGVVTIGVQADLSRIVVTARSLGGHYAAHSRAFRAEEANDGSELVVLPIAPRCHAMEVELPAVRLRESDRVRLELRAHGVDLDPNSCVGPLRGTSRMRVQLPRAQGFGRLEVELPPRAGEQATATRFATDWNTAWPEGELVLAPHQLAFTWSPPACVWELGTCPTATLEGGVACEATPLDDGTCQYLCPGSASDEEWIDVSPPVAVTFSKSGPEQRWSETLQRPGQVLSSYVRDDQIYLHADVSAWRRDVPGSRITHVELLENDGSARRYGVSEVEELQILAPRASCEPLRYRLVGDRRYLESAAPVRSGQVEFGEVHKTQRLMSFNLLLVQGGGLAFTYGGAPDNLHTPTYWTFLGQLAVNIRPRDPRLARVAYELRIGGTIGQWGYFGAGSANDIERRVSQKLAWARLLAEPAVVVNVIPSLAFGAGVGVGGSWPINNNFIPNTGRFSLLLAPSLDARFALRRWVSLVVQGRLIFGERSFVTDVVGTNTATQSYPNMSLVGLYGVQFSF